MNEVKMLEERLKVAIDKHYELNTWGLNNALMTHTLQVRATENLINCAQRLKYKGNDKHL